MIFEQARIKSAAALLFLSSGVVGCSQRSRPVAPAQESLSHVSVVRAEKKTIPEWLDVVGTVRSAQTTQVASRMMGNVVDIRVREGDRVRSGQVLSTIDAAEPKAAYDEATAALAAAQEAVAAADADFALAQSTMKRYQQLYQKKSVSPQEFDEVQSRYRSAQANLDVAHAREEQARAALSQTKIALSYTQVLAPFDGIITDKQAETGMLASPGMPLFMIEDTRSYRLEAVLDENDIALAHLGQAVRVSLDSIPSVAISGRVAQIVPAADSASRSFVVKIELPPDARFRSGLFGRARFPRGECSAILIPASAVVSRGQLRGVYVVDANQVAELRYVTVGQTSGQQVEALSGLEGGETLIATPGDQELGGKRIIAERIAERAAEGQ